MSRKTASRQASEAILRFSASAHDGSQKIRDETKKCPRSRFAWTLCKNRRPLLATDDLPVDLYAQWRDSSDQELGYENCSCRPAGEFPLGTPNMAAAAAQARDISLSLMAGGWEIISPRYKSSSATSKRFGTAKAPSGISWLSRR